MQGDNQRGIRLSVLGNMNAILPVQSIVLKRDVLAKSTRGQKKDDGNRGSHDTNIIPLGIRTREFA